MIINELLNSPVSYGLVAGLILYIYKRFRSADIQSVFIHDVATNHLPHIQSALELIAKAIGVELPASPPIRFISTKDFTDKEG